MTRPAIVVHGGAGILPPGANIETINAALRAARDAGWKRLNDSALDAVVAAVQILEDDPQFNAGHGAVLTSEGTVELDAAVMEGEQLRTGAVSLLTGIPNPVLGARAVMQDGKHVLMAGPGAANLVRSLGVPACDPDELIAAARGGQASGNTVGAVACDAHGRCAVAVSTGGIRGKLPGRIGDSPLCGAGFYADNRGGAACATGDGEAFIRTVSCKRIVDLLRQGQGAEMAAKAAVEELSHLPGEMTGGVIVVSNSGDIGITHSSPHMSWAWRNQTEES